MKNIEYVHYTLNKIGRKKASIWPTQNNLTKKWDPTTTLNLLISGRREQDLVSKRWWSKWVVQGTEGPQKSTLWMRPSLMTELLIFLNSSYKASTSLTLTEPQHKWKHSQEHSLCTGFQYFLGVSEAGLSNPRREQAKTVNEITRVHWIIPLLVTCKN